MTCTPMFRSDPTRPPRGVLFRTYKMTSLQIWPVENIPEVHPGMDLADLLLRGIQISGLSIQPRDIIAVTQKVISKAEGRVVQLSDIVASAAAVAVAKQVHKDPRLVEVILGETKRVVRARSD